MQERPCDVYTFRRIQQNRDGSQGRKVISSVGTAVGSEICSFVTEGEMVN